MNVFVQRMVKRFGELDDADAVAFAEKILEGWESVTPQGGVQSVPSIRERNLALVFLQLKYPFQCCGNAGKSEEDQRCPDCPMRGHNV